MSQVDFGEQGIGRQNFGRKQPPLIKLVMSLGLAKNEAGANKVLLGIAIVAIAIMVFTIVTQFGGSESAPLPADAIPAEAF
ncbi:MAG: hypothetical protein COV70_01325 [Parcubacteria group bacterium CG11_big_fil_rev_8_21_14_0_20_39_22]|nr:MAG: hypothetical protein COV70_01325 [Parcubacteria group bacterium CG11_big_fil_rev_8_21_14_0_20_39_22]